MYVGLLKKFQYPGVTLGAYTLVTNDRSIATMNIVISKMVGTHDIDQKTQTFSTSIYQIYVIMIITSFLYWHELQRLVCHFHKKR